MIKAYVVNMDKNPERMAFMAEQFERMGIPYERFSAVNGNAVSDAEYKAYCDARPHVSKVGTWTKGKMGCNLSHMALWEIAANSFDPYTAIFEDDVIMADILGELMADVSWIPADADIVRLEASTMLLMLLDKGGIPLKGRQLQRVLPNRFKNAFPVGTAAYIIKREAARRILDAPLADNTYTDRVLFDCTTSPVARMLRVYQVNPACAVQDKFHHADAANIRFASEIETDGEQHIYDAKDVGMMRKIKDIAKVFGVLQAFRRARKMLSVLMGYRGVLYRG